MVKLGNFVSHLFGVLMLLILLVSPLGVMPSHAAGVLYTKPSGMGDCSSWANACTLQTALTGAISGDEIWAAAGTYKPTAGIVRTATFQLMDSIALYGGFIGTEAARDQRDPAANVTILSGDIDNNDTQTPIITDLTTVTGNITNSYHVVTGATGATLDGFTVTAGNANESWNPYNYYGGGMYNNFSSPTLTNVTFIGNSAANGGAGGMYNYASSPTLTDVTFSGNSAINGGAGGGMMNNSSSPTLTNVTFHGNSTENGGGAMYNNSSSPTLTNVTFSANTAWGGGAMYNTGSSPTLTNVTFSDNWATNGVGAMYNSQGSNPVIYDSIFWNDGSEIVNELYSTLSAPTITDSIVAGGCPLDATSTCVNLITSDPLLVALANNGGFTQTMALSVGSPAIDAGDATLPPHCAATDQRGMTRPQGAHCDIGAFELRIFNIFLPLILR